MPARSGVDFLNRRQSISIESPCQPNQRRPEPTMDVGHLATDETAHKHIG
jgi:hypothetical protein